MTCSVKKSVLRNFAKFTGKHLCQSLFFNKVAVPVNLAKFLRTLFLQKTSGRLLPTVELLSSQNATISSLFESLHDNYEN